MSPLIVAVLMLAAQPSEGLEAAAMSPAAIPAEEVQAAPRTGPELREAVRKALRRWARPTDAQADTAARQFLALYKELEADDQLSQSQRVYFLTKVRIRLMRLGDQITKRLAREERLAKAGRLKTVSTPEGKADSLSRPDRHLQGPAPADPLAPG